MDPISVSPPAPSGDDNYVVRMISPAGQRLLWRLNGPLEQAITVAPSQYYEPDAVMEPYFRPASPDNDAAPNSSSWHAVSQESLLTPPASSVMVRVRCIDAWEQIWSEQHRECHDAVFSSPRRRVGPWPGDNTPDAFMFVFECCGEKRPWSKDIQLDVVANGAFVTIHEYVSVVHPWLMSMRDTLLEVLGKMDGKPPWPADAKLTVLYLGPGPLRIGLEDEWARWHRKPPAVRGSAVSDPWGDAGKAIERAKERAKVRAAAMIRAREEAASQRQEEDTA